MNVLVKVRANYKVIRQTNKTKKMYFLAKQFVDLYKLYLFFMTHVYQKYP